MEKNNVFMSIMKEVVKYTTSREGVKLMRDATAVSVAGSVVGLAIRNSLYKSSKSKGGWYSRYLDNRFVQKWCKADDKSVLVSAVIATALDTILVLDRSGVIKLHSIEEGSNDDPLKDIEDCKEAILKHVDIDSASAATTAETVPPSRDTTDDDEDDDLY